MTTDVRWKQRLNNLKRAFALLQNALAMKSLSDLERQGLIQCFEFTYELAWNTMKDFLEDQGFTSVMGPRDAIQEGFKIGLIADGKSWMRMHQSRNLTAHTYNESTALEIAKAISDEYANLFAALIATLEARRRQD